MKNKQEIKKLANRIVELEKQAQKFSEAGEDKSLQAVLSEIEIILESLSLQEGLELNDTVINILENN